MSKNSVSKTYTTSHRFALASESPRALSSILGLPGIVAHQLSWRSTSRSLLCYLLGVIGENGKKIELPHADLAVGLWPDTHSESGKRKLARWLAAFDEDQLLSGFVAVYRDQGRMVGRGDDVQFLPSTYSIVNYWTFAEIVGSRVVESGCLDVANARERDLQFRRIVQGVLIDLGANTILPEMRIAYQEQKAIGKELKKLEKKKKQVERGEAIWTSEEILAESLAAERLEKLWNNWIAMTEWLFAQISMFDDDVAAWKYLERVKRNFLDSLKRTITEGKKNRLSERRLAAIDRFEFLVDSDVESLRRRAMIGL